MQHANHPVLLEVRFHVCAGCLIKTYIVHAEGLFQVIKPERKYSRWEDTRAMQAHVSQYAIDSTTK